MARRHGNPSAVCKWALFGATALTKRPTGRQIGCTASLCTGSISQRKKSLAKPLPILKVHSSATSSTRSEEHTSELQSRGHLVCRLLLEKKNNESRCACTEGWC